MLPNMALWSKGTFTADDTHFMWSECGDTYLQSVRWFQICFYKVTTGSEALMSSIIAY